jgi:hypothetical protein
MISNAARFQTSSLLKVSLICTVAERPASQGWPEGGEIAGLGGGASGMPNGIPWNLAVCSVLRRNKNPTELSPEAG